MRPEWLLCIDDQKTYQDETEFLLENMISLSKATSYIIKRVIETNGLTLKFCLPADSETYFDNDGKPLYYYGGKGQSYYSVIDKSNKEVTRIYTSEFSSLRNEIVDYSSYLVNKLLNQHQQINKDNSEHG